MIGIGHYSRVGKDTFAKNLKEHLTEIGIESRIFKWADTLKQVAHEIYGWAGLKPGWYYEDPENEHFRDKVLEPLGLTPVEVWIKLGDKAREIHPETWIEASLNTHEPGIVYINSDTRYRNEVRAIQERGGLCIKLVRDKVLPRTSAADQDMLGHNDMWDIMYHNTTYQSLHDLAHWVTGIISNKWPSSYSRQHWDEANQVERKNFETVQPR